MPASALKANARTTILPVKIPQRLAATGLLAVAATYLPG